MLKRNASDVTFAAFMGRKERKKSKCAPRPNNLIKVLTRRAGISHTCCSMNWITRATISSRSAGQKCSGFICPFVCLNRYGPSINPTRLTLPVDLAPRVGWNLAPRRSFIQFSSAHYHQRTCTATTAKGIKWRDSLCERIWVNKQYICDHWSTQCSPVIIYFHSVYFFLSINK